MQENSQLAVMHFLGWVNSRPGLWGNCFFGSQLGWPSPLLCVAGRTGAESRTVQRPGDWKGCRGFGSMLKTSALCCDQPRWTFTHALWHVSLIHCSGDGDCLYSTSSLTAGIDKNCKDATSIPSQFLPVSSPSYNPEFSRVFSLAAVKVENSSDLANPHHLLVNWPTTLRSMWV